ncbi:MAG TPA: DNA polymerase III subunit alpha [Rubrivivax sp.]|nr:DNA polymerase III subunit alpha [Rubrivivax sp.]
MASTPRFVHLRLHTEYSVVDGTLRVGAAVAAASADAQPALAISDLGNLFGAIKFYKACRDKGVKPIIGADIWLEPPAEAGERQASRLLLLVQDKRGYLNLCELLARAWTRNVQRNQAWVKWNWLQELGDGLIALSGADLGIVGQALLAGDRARARSLAERLAAIFPRRFYLEVQRAGAPAHEAQLRAAVPLAADLGLPVVATHPVQFLEPDDYEAHEARVCIADGDTLDNPRRVRRFTPEQSFTTQAQMAERFADLPSALANTVQIAMRCSLGLELGKAHLPDFPTPDGLPLHEHFRRASHDGLERRLLALFPDEAQRERERPRYLERLEFEIQTIVKMDFPGYFMIVSDFIVWAKANGCPVGPGRGSGAGSLVAYALFITDLDPLRYQLLFERFLNPERVTMPDFDVDFCQANRDRVIDYVKDKYGRDAVSQIATFGTMAAKAALRDVGRVLGMGYGQVDAIAKLIPAPPGKTVTLAPVPEQPDGGLVYARREAPELEQREADDEEVAELLRLAMRVEGIVRNIGMHAGGVLIAPGKITDFCPLYQQPGSTNAVSQYDKDDVEAVGLVKFDFLGLATLTILELAKEFIRARRKGREDFGYETLPLDDPRVYKLFGDGLTEAVFQFESFGMQAMLREARPKRLEDLIALNAMFRPGPMENIPSFCARKNGREAVQYPHPLLEPVLAETYGIFVYQEQVMQAAQVMGGYSLGGADLLRRAMGKKKPEEMAKERVKFREGAMAQGIDGQKADEVFDLMEKFAGYGFNKSHAAAYSLLAYHTAWLKVHCAAEFYAANMTIEADDTSKLAVLLADARLFGIAVAPPDVNRGTLRFEPVSDTLVRYGLGAIKGTGAGAIEAIVAAREGLDGQGGGPFRSLFDFCARVDRSRVNKRVVEALIRAGAFDALHPSQAADRIPAVTAASDAAAMLGRAELLASVGLAFDWADAQAANEAQCGLFDFGDDIHGSSRQEPALVAAEPFGLRERLQHEKLALGFHLSGHLFDIHAEEVRRFCKRPIAALADSREPVLVAGIVGALRFANRGNSRSGRMLLFRIDDGSESVEAVITDENLLERRDLPKEDELVVVQGRTQPDRLSGLRLNVQQVWDLAAARAHFGRHLAVEVGAVMPPVAELVRLGAARRVENEDGEGDAPAQGLNVRLLLRRAGAAAELDLGDDGRIWPSDEVLARWQAAAHEHRARVIYD